MTKIRGASRRFFRAIHLSDLIGYFYKDPRYNIPAMRAILIHGLGRTPMSMLPLSVRLRRRGFRTKLFGYSPTLEKLDAVLERLRKCVEREAGDFILIGHSLGTVIIREFCRLQGARKPEACFLLAPPIKACGAARHFSRSKVFQLFTGDMGRKLADERFMSNIPAPNVKTVVFAGTAGPRGRFSPFGQEANDGILSATESRLPGAAAHVEVRALHSFIMNSGAIAEYIGKEMGMAAK
jgi:pimeloyl-ACP methyl ester carboxylesterase